MNLEEAKSHVDRLERAQNTRDLDLLLGLYNEQYIAHANGKQVVLRGKEQLKKWITSQWAAFSDYRFMGEVLSVSDDSYTCLYSNSGTHDGSFLGVPPTGKRFESWGLFLSRILDGQMIESWTVFDEHGMRTQLGFVQERE